MGPHPAFGAPLPRGRERGKGERDALLTHGSRRGLYSAAPVELAYSSMNFSNTTLAIRKEALWAVHLSRHSPSR